MTRCVGTKSSLFKGDQTINNYGSYAITTADQNKRNQTIIMDPVQSLLLTRTRVAKIATTKGFSNVSCGTEEPQSVFKSQINANSVYVS